MGRKGVAGKDTVTRGDEGLMGEGVQVNILDKQRSITRMAPSYMTASATNVHPSCPD
jgi:hypothetical protein